MAFRRHSDIIPKDHHNKKNKANIAHTEVNISVVRIAYIRVTSITMHVNRFP